MGGVHVVETLKEMVKFCKTPTSGWFFTKLSEVLRYEEAKRLKGGTNE